MGKTRKTIRELQFFDFSIEPGRELNERISINSGVPLISVITIFSMDINKEYALQMFKCLKNQTFPFWEWIIIINNKETLPLIDFKNEDKRVRVIQYDYETIAKAKYYAVKNSMADIIFNYEENDLIDKTMLECGFFTLHFNKEATFAYSKMVEFGKKELLVNHQLKISNEKKRNIISPGAFIRKDKYLEVDNYEDLKDNEFREWYMWLDFLSKGYIPLKMGFYGYWHRNLKKYNKLNLKDEELSSRLKEKADKIDPKTEIIQFDNSYEVSYKNVPEKVNLKTKPIVPDNDKKRVLFILPWSVIGGADLFNFNLIKGLRNKGYEISVITTLKCDYALRQGIEQYVDEYFDLTTFLKRKDWASFLEYVIRSRRIKLVFLSNSYYGYYALPWLKCQFKDIPFVDYIHAENWTLRNGGFPKDSNSIADYLDSTYTCTKHLRDVMYKTMQRNVKNVKPVYIGTDPNFYNPNLSFEEEKELREFYKDNKVILFISRIVHYKRPLFALNVIKKLAEARDDVRLAIVGDGQAMNDVKNYIIENDLQNLVTCYGEKQEVRPFYKIADCTLICSLREGLTLTTYESLSMGVPIVSADIGGQKELIGEDIGALIEPYQIPDQQFDFNYSEDEIKKYAEAILKILNDSEIEKIKEKCRKKILDDFSIEKMIDTLDKEFTKLMKTGSNVNKEILKNVELAERYLLVHSVLESKDEREKHK